MLNGEDHVYSMIVGDFLDGLARVTVASMSLIKPLVATHLHSLQLMK